MTRASRPSRIDERIVKILLHVVHQFLAAIGHVQLANVGGGVFNEPTV
jgi:hypothetical protein